MFLHYAIIQVEGNMLQQDNRLKKKAAFTATYNNKNSRHKNGITVYFGREKKEDEELKIGFVVSKKTHKRATKRNRLKRLMRESCRLLIKNGFTSNYLSLIFVGHESALNLTFKEIDESIKSLLGVNDGGDL